MRSILYISCSPKNESSISLRFAEEVLTRLRQHHPEAGVQRRDLARNPPPFVNAAFCEAILVPGEAAAAFEQSEILIQELEQADAVVIATPMHNYGVPAVLKAWVDQVVR